MRINFNKFLLFITFSQKEPFSFLSRAYTCTCIPIVPTYVTKLFRFTNKVVFSQSFRLYIIFFLCKLLKMYIGQSKIDD